MIKAIAYVLYNKQSFTCTSMPDRWASLALLIAFSSNIFLAIDDAFIQHLQNLEDVPATS